VIRLTALMLTVLTGFAGLVYEVAWQKYLATLLGSHAEATAAVLAIFLGGLSGGYALFGRATRWSVERARRLSRPARLLALYALVEAGIGLYALLFPQLFGIAQHVSLLVPHDDAALGFAFDVALSALLIGPPSVLMGGTIPILTLALAGGLEDSTRVHAWVYGANTLGAFAGALAGGFFLVPLLGLDGVVLTIGCVNLFAAACFALLQRRSEPPVELSEPTGAEPVARFAAWASVSLLAGFAMMALQTTFNRIGALAFGSSQFTFAMVVAVFVLSIALGSLAVSALPRIPRGLVAGSQWALLGLLFPLYLVIADAPYWALAIRVQFSQMASAFHLYHLVVFLALFAVLAIPIGLSGALLPLLFHQLRREVRNLGSVAGRLYAWNTVGSLLGALLGGYVLLFWLDLHHVYRIAMAALLVGASILTWLALESMPRIVPILGLLPMLLAIWMLPPWPAERLASGLFRKREVHPEALVGPDEFFARMKLSSVVFYDDDPTSSVAVTVPNDDPDNPSIMVNGKSDGALVGDYTTMALSALIPALMAERNDRAFVIGLGTGVTAGDLASLQSTREIVVAEISKGVIAANPEFERGNQAPLRSPKVEVIRSDAYRALQRGSGQYDIIVSEPSNPWVMGVEMLYSREFLEAARKNLAPGGVYGQWFHLYESNTGIVELVFRNYASVFPYVSVWFTSGPDLLLLGFDRPDRALDVEALRERFWQPDFVAGFQRVGIRRFPQLLAHELLPLGTLHAAELPGELHTLRHPILSDRAARAFFVGRMAQLPIYLSDAHRELADRNSMLRRYAGEGAVFSEDVLESVTHETCRLYRYKECASFFALWELEHPGSSQLAAALARSRKRLGSRASEIAPGRLATLGRLRSGKGLDGSFAISAKKGLALSNDFVDHYHHAAPFDLGLLESLWKQCRGENCDETRREVMEGLGKRAHADAAGALPLQHHRAPPLEMPRSPETVEP
jgi:spermidine synthase